MLNYSYVEMLSVAALGAFALWMRLKYGASFQRGLERLINDILDDFRPRMLFQIGIFVIIGALVSVIMVGPSTKRQAMAAGMAWTALLGGIANSGAGATRSRKGADHGKVI